MRKLLLTCLLVFFVTGPSVNAAVNAEPDFELLKFAAQLPPELPQRITGFAYDGEKLWAAIYLGQGLYVTLDPSTLKWTISKDEKARQAIGELSGSFYSPGGICFVNGKLWIGASYGDSYGSID